MSLVNNKRVLIQLVNEETGGVEVIFTYNEKGPLIYVQYL